jgi:hypothetical protein
MTNRECNSKLARALYDKVAENSGFLVDRKTLPA